MAQDDSNKRMRELTELFKKKNEIFVQKKKENIDESALKSEYDRLSKLAGGQINSTFKENYLMSGDYGVNGANGKTVNTMVDTMFDNSATAYKPIRQPLQAEEAFDIAIKRALKSGAPVNDIGFYDEVNWNLNNLGFAAKNAIDIKNYIVKQMDKE